MAQQLRLLDTRSTRFRLAERTKATGRRGIEKARAALRESAQRAESSESAVAEMGGRTGRPASRRTDAAGAADNPADAA